MIFKFIVSPKLGEVVADPPIAADLPAEPAVYQSVNAAPAVTFSIPKVMLAARPPSATYSLLAAVKKISLPL